METFQIGVILSILSGICTACWTVLTWQRQQDKEERIRRSKHSALYINPFILSAEELQTKLYKFLTKKRQTSIGDREPTSYAGFSSDALEVLYVIIIYFGWSFIVYRYGPYTSDRKAIELNRKISEIFANTDEFSEQDAFYFSFAEQRALGLTFVKLFEPKKFIREEHSVLPGFESISLFQFEEEIKNQRNEHSAFYTNIRDTLHSIDDSKTINDLKGRKRLILIQNYLVDLLNYLEEKEGFSVSIKQRQKIPIKGSDLHDLRGIYGITNTYQIVHHISGRIRLKVSNLQESQFSEIQSLLCSLSQVETVTINSAAASITIDYDPTIPQWKFEQQILEVMTSSDELNKIQQP